MGELPTGTVTFLFTDIEGSTKLARTLGDRWGEVLERHHDAVGSAILRHHGTIVRTEGDAFFAVFASARDAVEAAADAQRELAEQAWPEDGTVRVRMGMHSGEGRLSAGDYAGLDVHLAARIAAAGHGGQVLLSDATHALVTGRLPAGIDVRDLGEHRLKDFDEPQRIHQLVIEGLAVEFAPLRTLETPTNLPSHLTSFVGREREVSELVALLDRERLVTLVGPGGTGKTRLAVEAATRRLREHPDGVFFIDLSPIRDADLVPTSVMQVLGLKERPSQPRTETIAAHLRDRHVLLVLDNFEQVLDAAPVVGDALNRSANVRALATSRIRLGLMGEQSFPVPPLGVPDEDTDPAALGANEAVALFRDRARAVLPSFDLTPENARAVAQICARLDGLPLAIELAAAQIRLLTPAELLRRLEHRLPLRTGAANVPERQRTLRGTIEWSYELLAEAERKLFARMAVFAGGATLEAIEAICNPGDDVGTDTIDAVSALFDASLLRRDDLPDGSRFRMLETVREYARERLMDSFDAEATERRHALYYRELTLRWGDAVRGSSSAEALRVLGAEHDNIRAAIAWAVQNDEGVIGIEIASHMWKYWVETGRRSQGASALGELLDLPSASTPDDRRAAGLAALGALTYWEGRIAEAIGVYREALAICRDIGDPALTVEALKDLAYALVANGEPDASLPLILEAQARAAELGDDRAVAETAGLRSIAHAQRGEFDDAIASVRQFLEYWERSPEGRYWVPEALSRVGSIYRVMGRLDDAERYQLRSIEVYRDQRGNVGIGAAMKQAATLALERGDVARALRLSGFAEAVDERLGGAPPAKLMLVPEPDEIRAAARGTFDDDTIDRLWAEGRSMTSDEAIEEALAMRS